jgi:hypothetical protein
VSVLKLTPKHTEARFVGSKALSANWHATVSTVVTMEDSNPELGTEHTDGRATMHGIGVIVGIDEGDGVGVVIGVGVGVDAIHPTVGQRETLC